MNANNNVALNKKNKPCTCHLLCVHFQSHSMWHFRSAHLLEQYVSIKYLNHNVILCPGDIGSAGLKCYYRKTGHMYFQGFRWWGCLLKMYLPWKFEHRCLLVWVYNTIYTRRVMFVYTSYSHTKVIYNKFCSLSLKNNHYQTPHTGRLRFGHLIRIRRVLIRIKRLWFVRKVDWFQSNEPGRIIPGQWFGVIRSDSKRREARIRAYKVV